MSDKPKRRWFQFRLRTLLLGVVLSGAACGYVAHEWRLVEARRNWSQQHADDGLLPEEISDLVGLGPAMPDSTIPFIRRWLGDLPAKYVAVHNRAEETTATQLFPEAKIVRLFDGSKK